METGWASSNTLAATEINYRNRSVIVQIRVIALFKKKNDSIAFPYIWKTPKSIDRLKIEQREQAIKFAFSRQY